MIFNSLPSPCTVAPGEVPSLEHEVPDHPVELGPLVSLALGLLGQLYEVLHGLGHGLPEQPDLDPTGRLVADADVEPHLVGHLKYGTVQSPPRKGRDGIKGFGLF